jgi:hypothetical protein
MKTLKERYIEAKANLDAGLKKYYEVAAKIEAQYEEKYGAQEMIENDELIDKLFDDQEDARAELGIFALEVKAQVTEQDLLEDFRNRLDTADIKAVAHAADVDIDFFKDMYKKALFHVTYRRKLVEMAIRY